MAHVIFYFLTKRPKYASDGKLLGERDAVSSCLIPVNAFKFLDLDSVYNEDEQRKLKARVIEQYTRTGQQASSADATATNITVRKHNVTVTGRKPRGGKSVRLRTGKVTPTSANRKNKIFHSISFNFPSWMSAQKISDFLGEIIPETKLSLTPSAAEVYPSFTLKSGGSHPIMTKTTASGLTPAEGGVSTDQTQVAAAGA